MGILKRIFGNSSGNEYRAGSKESVLSGDDIGIIGTEEDLMRDYDAQAERNFQAMEAEQSGDVGTAIALYEQNIREKFVGAHPYENLARIYESRGRSEDALRVTETFITLTKSGRLPKGSQRSAERKLPDFEARAARLGNGSKA